MAGDAFDIRQALGARSTLMAMMGDGLEVPLKTAVDAIVSSIRDGGVVYACGNGGSATQAQHFAAELVGRFKMDRRSLPAFALTDNLATITSIANDYDYEEVFARQIGGIVKPGDSLLALSTSGRSVNVVRACVAARDKSATVVALTGQHGGDVAAHSDIVITVPHADTALVQEAHLVIVHLICQLVESAMFSGPTHSD